MEASEPGILKAQAMKAAERSHAPFSQYQVGAALQTADDNFILGCNIESSSYGLTVCAERNAIAAAIAQGHTNFKALGVYSKNGATPCGACRQVIWDICGNIPIYIFDGEGHITKYAVAELLPHPFDKQKLESQNR